MTQNVLGDRNKYIHTYIHTCYSSIKYNQKLYNQEWMKHFFGWGNKFYSLSSLFAQTMHKITVLSTKMAWRKSKLSQSRLLILRFYLNQSCFPWWSDSWRNVIFHQTFWTFLMYSQWSLMQSRVLVLLLENIL